MWGRLPKWFDIGVDEGSKRMEESVLEDQNSHWFIVPNEEQEKKEEESTYRKLIEKLTSVSFEWYIYKPYYNVVVL